MNRFNRTNRSPVAKFAGFAITLSLLVSVPAGAADAVFSADGKHVYLRRFDGSGKLTRLDIQSGDQQTVSLPDAIGRGPGGLARDKSGNLLCVTGKAVWRLDASLEAAEQICTAGEDDRRFRDIAFDPGSGHLLITAVSEIAADKPVHELLVLRRAGEVPAKVRMRRVDRIEGMAFTADGLLAFGYRGDLWLGRVAEEIIPQSSEDPVRAAQLAKLPPYIRSTLEAFRYAPLATHETADTTGSQTGVAAVAASTSHAFVHVSRINGSGWGKVVRVPLPAPPDSASDPKVADATDFDRRLPLDQRLATYRSVLDAVEIFGENGRSAQLCTAPNGTDVHFYADRRHWLAKGGDPPAAITAGKAPD